MRNLRVLTAAALVLSTEPVITAAADLAGARNFASAVSLSG